MRAQLLLRRGQIRPALAIVEELFRGVDPSSTTLRSREAHETAWRAYEAAGRPAEALVHLSALKRLDDDATRLATSTNTALMGARFDYANQELRIAKLRADELRHNVDYERARAHTERLVFAGISAGTLVLVVLLATGLVAIRRSRDAVRTANRGLGVANGELTRALAARDEFLATTSHEIRTPLNGILGMTQVMLADHGLTEAVRDRVGLVHAAGTTMRALVDDILDVAKIESGRLTLEEAPFDLAREVRETCATWAPQVRAKGVEFELELDAPAGPVAGDAVRVRQVLFNLLSNAAKFTREGRVTVCAGWSDGAARVSVSDTGIGIPADKLEKVFESFAQADAGVTRQFGGTGLGLSICRSLARAMGGDVAVTSRPGEGSCFTFTVPLPLADVAPAEAVDRPPPVLVVDRGPITRAMVRSLLERAGLPVSVAASIEEAAVVLAQAPARRVLVDESALRDRPDMAGDLARLAGAGSPVLLLWTGDDAPPLPDGCELLRKPVAGPALVLAASAPCSRALVSEAA